MWHKRGSALEKRIKALMPKKGSFAYVLLKIGQAAGVLVLIKIDEIWCNVIPPDRRPNESDNQNQGRRVKCQKSL